MLVRDAFGHYCVYFAFAALHDLGEIPRRVEVAVVDA